MIDTGMNNQRIQRLWLDINQLHITYLEKEESPDKLKKRAELEERIQYFLYLVSPDQKFSYSQTAHILLRSAVNKKDFSAYKAATGWNSIQLYAENLLRKPWRSEYKTIKTYCGFYTHQVGANLVGAELMFEAMGYKHCSDGTLKLDEFQADAIVNVSRDCLIAYVECQILKSAWEEISKRIHQECSWLHILNCRMAHACDLNQLVFELEEQLTGNQFKDCTNHINLQSTLHPPAMMQMPMTNGMFRPAAPVPLIIPTNNCYELPHPAADPNLCGNMMMMVHPMHPTGMPYGAFSYGGAHLHPAAIYAMTPASYPSINNGRFGEFVPTARLIEVESMETNGFGCTARADSSNLSSARSDHTPLAKSAETATTSPGEKIFSDINNEKNEDWNYVYADLTRQGYRKDMGERGDILLESKASMADRSSKPTHLDAPLKFSEALDKFDGTDVRITRSTSKILSSNNSSYENLDHVCGQQANSETNNSHKEPSKNTKKTLPSSRKLKVSNQRKVKKDTAISAEAIDDEEKWQCKTCTYLNRGKEVICEMCSKSRHFDSENAIEVGCPECLKCTLVNHKNAQRCRACNESLKDSPTYI